MSWVSIVDDLLEVPATWQSASRSIKVCTSLGKRPQMSEFRRTTYGFVNVSLVVAYDARVQILTVRLFLEQRFQIRTH